MSAGAPIVLLPAGSNKIGLNAPVWWPGGEGILRISGAFNGSTCQLVQNDGATPPVAINVGNAVTTSGEQSVKMGPGPIYINITVAAPTSIQADITPMFP